VDRTSIRGKFPFRIGLKKADVAYGRIKQSEKRMPTSKAGDAPAGAGLAPGLLTPVCAAMLTGDMIVAVATTSIRTIQASGFRAWFDDFLYLPEVLYILILVWLIFSGPGRCSVDGLFGVER
jgi:uncharacterized membrane protein YphA (DoxX/SURF4 family)